MDKKQFRKILDERASEDLVAFRKSLPIEEKLFPRLFEFIDSKVANQGCNHDFTFTKEFCQNHRIDSNLLLDWIVAQSQACDCEVLNLEDAFQHLNQSPPRTISKPQQSSQKLKSLQTDFGFRIDNVPTPWTLVESTSKTGKTYTFQIGKSTICLVSLIAAPIAGKINDDQFLKDQWILETDLTYNLDFEIEKLDVEGYKCVQIKSKNFLPVLVWCENSSAQWHLKMRTERSRLTGDFKELQKLVNSISAS